MATFLESIAERASSDALRERGGGGGGGERDISLPITLPPKYVQSS